MYLRGTGVRHWPRPPVLVLPELSLGRELQWPASRAPEHCLPAHGTVQACVDASFFVPVANSDWTQGPTRCQVVWRIWKISKDGPGPQVEEGGGSLREWVAKGVGEQHTWRSQGHWLGAMRQERWAEPRKGGWAGEMAPRNQAQQGLSLKAGQALKGFMRMTWCHHSSGDHSGCSLESGVEGAKLTGRVAGRYWWSLSGVGWDHASESQEKEDVRNHWGVESTEQGD